MPEVSSDPGYIHGTCTLAGDGYSHHIETAALVPTAKNAIVRDITAQAHPVGGASDWALALSVFGQPGAAASLTGFLLAHDGETVAGTVVADGASYAFSVVIAAAQIGLDPSNVAKASVSMPCSKPIPTYPGG